MDSNVYLVVLTLTISLSIISYYLTSYLTQVTYTQRANKIFLLFFIASCSFTLFTKFYLPQHVFVYIGAPFIMFYGPFFFYFLVCLDRERNSYAICKTKVWYHFLIPGIFSLVYLFAVFNLETLGIKFLVYYYLTLYLVTGVTLAIYAVFGYLMLMRGQLAHGFRLFLLGVVWYMLFMAIVIVGLGIYNVIPNNDQDVIYYGNLVLAILLFHYSRQQVIEFRNLHLQALKSEKVQVKTPVGVTSQVQQNTVADQSTLDYSGKYIKSQLSAEYLRTCQKKIEHYAVDLKYYKQADFNVDKLRALTGIPKYHIAQAFTVLYGMNFNSFINEKRIEYALLLLEQEDYNISVNDLSERSGFNSRTSFFRAFKKKTGMSPTHYIEDLKYKIKKL
ncbi:helix-turn-helix domain-containing protein [Myroides sp. LJL119]